jgi:hypothetical protein
VRDGDTYSLESLDKVSKFLSLDKIQRRSDSKYYFCMFLGVEVYQIPIAIFPGEE